MEGISIHMAPMLSTTGDRDGGVLLGTAVDLVEVFGDEIVIGTPHPQDMGTEVETKAAG